MAPLSLKERAAVVRERFGLATFGASTLQGYYMRHGVRYKRPDYRYWKSRAENAELKAKQYSFVEALGTIIRDRAYDDVVYIDETTFHLWQKASRCWIRPGMKLPMHKNRGPSLTVIGAISEARGLVHYTAFAGSNNADTFAVFLAALKAKCPGRTVVVLDNLRIHISKKLEAVYDGDFKEMFVPPYSCDLNPIEHLWALLKRRWSAGLCGFAAQLYNDGRAVDVTE